MKTIVQKPKHAGQLTISRVHGGEEGRPICIRLNCSRSGIEFVEAHLSLADFASALTGLAHVECNLEVRGLQNVGLYRERKTITVTIPESLHKRLNAGHKLDDQFDDKVALSQLDAICDAALAEDALANGYTTDGFRQSWAYKQFRNSHAFSRHPKKKQVTAQVSFYRFVPEDPTPQDIEP